MPVPTIFLDLDNTLVHTSRARTSSLIHFHLTSSWGGKPWFVHCRPGLHHFLVSLSSMVDEGKCNVGVWSAGECAYVWTALKGVCKVLNLDECVSRNLFSHIRARHRDVDPAQYKKDLCTVGKNCLLLDDNPGHRMNPPTNRGHVITLPPFFCDQPYAHMDKCLWSALGTLQRRVSYHLSMCEGILWTQGQDASLSVHAAKDTADTKDTATSIPPEVKDLIQKVIQNVLQDEKE